MSQIGFYKGNVIFRNQPNHSYFDKPMKDPEDCFYLSLNEINPHFLKPEQQADKRGFENNTITDPRTQKPVTQLCFDHTREARIKMFRCPKYSTMSRQQHMTAVDVLQALQNEDEVEEEKMCKWYSFENARLNERQEFQKFVYEFNQTNKELIYKPAKKLLELYQNWYVVKVKSLMLKYPVESYNTHLGLPQVRICKDILNNQIATLENQELVAKIGHQWIWQEDGKTDFKNLQYSIDFYMEEYIASQDLKEKLDNEIKMQFREKTTHESTDFPILYIPIESLLFLLNAGDYPDLSMEMLLNIEGDDQLGDIKKYIIMDSPLPSREGGWHTYKQVVDQAAIAFISMNKTQKYVNYNLSEEQIDNEDDIPEIKSNVGKSRDFNVCSISNYLEHLKFNPAKNCKFSKSLIKWQLNPSANETGFQIYTSLTQTALNNASSSKESSSNSLSSVSIKLEYKPQFGCEIMTKYEMLEEWFKLKLLQASKSICLRLDINNFQTLLQESLTLQKLEQSLNKIYQIEINELLTNLFEFLKIIQNMPPGHYMLRYNPKFKDKLMLCKPSKEITQNTIHLHQLLNTQPTDLLFMSQQNFLPISDNLCSLMHLQHKCIPCAFRPSCKPQQHKSKKAKKQPIAKKLNDKDWILNRFEKKKHKEQQKTMQARINHKKLQRTRRRIRLNAALTGKIKENTDEQEIEHEIALDFKMLGT